MADIRTHGTVLDDLVEELIHVAQDYTGGSPHEPLQNQFAHLRSLQNNRQLLDARQLERTVTGKLMMMLQQKKPWVYPYISWRAWSRSNETVEYIFGVCNIHMCGLYKYVDEGYMLFLGCNESSFSRLHIITINIQQTRLYP